MGSSEEKKSVDITDLLKKGALIVTIFGGIFYLFNLIVSSKIEPVLTKIEQKVNPIDKNLAIVIANLKNLDSKIDTIKDNDLKHIDDKLETNTKDIKQTRRDLNESLTKIYQLLLTMQNNKKKKTIN